MKRVLSGVAALSFPLIPAEDRRPSPVWEFRNRLKSVMHGFGFTEAITYSFISDTFADRLRLSIEDRRRRQLEILNPLTEDQSVMRTSLIPGLLTARWNNGNHQIAGLLRVPGVPSYDQPPESNGYRIERWLYTLDGDPADLGNITQNERYVSILRVTPEQERRGKLIFSDPLAAINVGVETFYESLKAQGAEVVQVDWRPPAGGNEDLMNILEKMRN